MAIDFDTVETDRLSRDYMTKSRATGMAKWLATLAVDEGATLPYGAFSIPSARSTCSSVGKELDRVFKLKADIKNQKVYIMRMS